jgi:hypothetical protein
MAMVGESMGKLELDFPPGGGGGDWETVQVHKSADMARLLWFDPRLMGWVQMLHPAFGADNSLQLSSTWL